jgi:hypothetical protein
MGLVSDKLVCGWNYPGSFLDELRKTTKLRIMPRRNGTSTPRAYGVKPVTNECQQAIITAARQSQTCTLLLLRAQGYRPKSKCCLPQTNTPASRSRFSLRRITMPQGGRPKNRGSIAGRDMTSLLNNVQTTSGAPSAFYSMGTGLSRGVKRPGHEADQYPPEASAVITNG